MKFTNLFNGPYHDCLDESGKTDVDKQHSEWMKEMFSFLFCGLILGIILGIIINV